MANVTPSHMDRHKSLAPMPPPPPYTWLRALSQPPAAAAMGIGGPGPRHPHVPRLPPIARGRDNAGHKAQLIALEQYLEKKTEDVLRVEAQELTLLDRLHRLRLSVVRARVADSGIRRTANNNNNTNCFPCFRHPQRPSDGRGAAAASSSSLTRDEVAALKRLQRELLCHVPDTTGIPTMKRNSKHSRGHVVFAAADEATAAACGKSKSPRLSSAVQHPSSSEGTSEIAKAARSYSLSGKGSELIVASFREEMDAESDDEAADELADKKLQEILERLRASPSESAAAVAVVEGYGDTLVKFNELWLGIFQRCNKELAMDMYRHFLSNHPTYQQLLPMPTMQEQAQASLDMVRRGLALFGMPSRMVFVMEEMGARHCLHGVHREHYDALAEAFLAVYPKYVSEEICRVTQWTWKVFFNKTIKFLDNGSHTPRAEVFRARHREQWVSVIQGVIAVLVEKQRAPLGSDRRHLFVHKLYEFMVARDSRLSAYVKLTDVGVADRSFDCIVRIIEHLHEYESILAYVRQVGAAHISIGLTIDAFYSARGAFLQTCQFFVGDEAAYTPQVEAALGNFWDFVTEQWNRLLQSPPVDFLIRNAPKDGGGTFCMLYSDVEASTRLWELNGEAMGAAVERHHAIIRSCINDYGGYEVKTVGDSFVIATKDALIALKIALGVQLELMRAPIAEGFEMVDDTQGGGDDKCWRKDSLRVRIGIHYCTEATAVFDRVNNSYDYYGPDVILANSVEGLACGGQVLITEQVVTALHAVEKYTAGRALRVLTGIDDADRKAVAASIAAEVPGNSQEYSLSSYVTMVDEGVVHLGWLDRSVHLFSATHRSLAGRVFRSKQKTDDSSYAFL